MTPEYTLLRDPIHGFIRVNRFEREVINSAPFQRLRHIKQLALTHMVYHGAEHTRFGHALGVMALASRVFDVLALQSREQIRSLLGWNEEDTQRYRQLLRLAAALHDIGHPPFSHATEKDLFPQGLDHTTYGKRIVEETVLREIIDTHGKPLGISTADLIPLFGSFEGSRLAFLQKIFAGDLDVDRMDYLLRDSLYTGVSYGLFDLDRLIHTMTLAEDPKGGEPILVIEEGGIHAAEGLLLGRYFMFTQVYFHKVCRAYNILLTDFVRQILPRGKYPKEIHKFLELDDLSIYAKMKEDREGLGSRILSRSHYQCLFETSESGVSEEIKKFEEFREKILQRFPGVDLKEDVSDSAPHRFAHETFYVKKGNGELSPMDQESLLIRTLQPIRQRRLYLRNPERIEIDELQVASNP
ncbi:MAG: HD domain-containing protein [Deltaproteobacteria bacterium]|nr:HD domain-containing protein [Deltaproteobacteria bacterium]